MSRHLLPVLLLAPLSVWSQCSIDLPTDTVQIYWGYAPLSCVQLAPAVVGASPNALLWSTGDTSATITVCDTSSSWYSVQLTDDTLCTATDSVFVHVIDVHCGNNGNKVSVCHIPPGNPANAHTICISENGVPAHLAHGCQLGPCAADTVNSGNATQLMMSVTPNPMAANAVVTLQTSVAQRVRLSVVDAMGRRISILLDAEMSADERRTFALDRAIVPVGTSVCWIQAEGAAERQVIQVVLTQ